MTAILFSPAIGPVPIGVFLSERHESSIEMTSVPIEGSADATDHAYALPDRVTIEIASESAAATYQALRDWQKARVPFTLVTGLEIYDDMLIESIRPERDKAFSNVFRGTVELRQVIIVETAYVPAGIGAGMPSGLSSGAPGGTDSVRAAPLSSSRALGDIASIRMARTTTRGVATTSLAPTVAGLVTGIVNTPAQNRAILAQVFG